MLGARLQPAQTKAPARELWAFVIYQTQGVRRNIYRQGGMLTFRTSGEGYAMTKTNKENLKTGRDCSLHANLLHFLKAEHV
jgi:hypothetical protein